MLPNFRKLDEQDLLEQFMEIREEELFDRIKPDDKRIDAYFDEYKTEILNGIPKRNREKICKLLFKMDENYMKSFSTWGSIYYKNGFVDGVQMILRCLSNK